jgi:hypothetical protein
MDSWVAQRNGKVVHQAQDSQGKGRPDVLILYDSEGRAIAQEVVSDGKRRPDKRIFLDAAGAVTGQCLDTDANGSLDARATVSGGAVTEVLLETRGKVDRREIYSGGQRVRLEADTNGDRKVDVIQTFSGQNLARQDEDSNYDGKIDQSFEAGKPVAVPANPNIANATLPALDCGRFNDFWKGR